MAELLLSVILLCSLLALVSSVIRTKQSGGR